jgi:hypothetical protein
MFNTLAPLNLSSAISTSNSHVSSSLPRVARVLRINSQCAINWSSSLSKNAVKHSSPLHYSYARRVSILLIKAGALSSGLGYSSLKARFNLVKLFPNFLSTKSRKSLHPWWSLKKVETRVHDTSPKIYGAKVRMPVALRALVLILMCSYSTALVVPTHQDERSLASGTSPFLSRGES